MGHLLRSARNERAQWQELAEAIHSRPPLLVLRELLARVDPERLHWVKLFRHRDADTGLDVADCLLDGQPFEPGRQAWMGWEWPALRGPHIFQQFMILVPEDRAGHDLSALLQEKPKRPDAPAGEATPHLSQQEEALRATQEAVVQHRALALRNPEAFLPDLAVSLWKMSFGFSELGQPGSALAPAQEALDSIWPFFERLPLVFATHTGTILQEVLHLHGALGRAPPPALLERRATFERLVRSSSRP